MSNKFINILEVVGKDCLKALNEIFKYAVPVESLAGLLFPQFAPLAAEAVSATTLVQNAVMTIEAKYAASGNAAGTGAQKLADVLSITETTVIDLLSKAGIQADSAYVKRIVNAVVAVLNVQGVK